MLSVIKKRIKAMVGSEKLLRGDMIISAAFFALTLCVITIPMRGFTHINESGNPFPFGGEDVVSFSRQFGQALANGIDIEKRIHNMTFNAFFYLPLLFLFWWLCLSLLFRKSTPSSNGISFMNRLSMTVAPSVVIALFLSASAAYYIPIGIAFVLATILYLRFAEEKMALDTFQWALLTSLPITFILLRLADFLFTFSERGSTVNELLFLAILLGSIVVSFRYGMCVENINREPMLAATTPIYAAPVCIGVVLETTNILNQYGLIIKDKRLPVLAISLCCILTGLIYYFFVKKKQSFPRCNYRKNQGILLILGMAMLALQPPIQFGAWPEFFETSNAGSDVYALLSAGEIPLVENLNVHMILEEIGQVLYGLFNNDPVGAVWYGYPVVTVLCWLVLYTFFAQLTNRENALFFTVLFPVGMIMWVVDAMALLPVIAALALIKKKKFSTILLFVLSCAVSCLYRADIGLYSSLAALLVLSVYWLGTGERQLLLKLWLTGISAGLCAVLAFVILCMMRGISPLARLLEAVSIMTDTNSSWAYQSVSPEYGLTFFVSYLVIPAASVVCLIALLLRKDKRQNSAQIIVVAVLVIAQLLSFGRGIVRHNLLENRIVFHNGYSILAIAVSLWLFSGKKYKALPVCLSGIMLFQPITGTAMEINKSLLQESAIRQMQGDLYEGPEEIVDRSIIPNYFKNLKTIFDVTLTPEQSFLDYSFQTTIYALTERNKPVYTNQSPSQLNHEFDHLLFLRELEEIDCPYAVSHVGFAGWDGISLDFRHYLIAEYLYENYCPLCIADSYLLWVKKDEYLERRNVLERLKQYGAIEFEIIEYDSELLKRYNELGDIPHLWGTYDRATSQEKLGIIAFEMRESLPIPQVLTTNDANRFDYLVSEGLFPNGFNHPRVAIWCERENGQDDLIWYDLEKENGVLFTQLDIGAHLGQQGEYFFDLYYDDPLGEPQFLTRTIKHVPVLENQETKYCRLDPADYDRRDGNYIEIVATTDTEGKAAISLLDYGGKELSSVSFTLKPGQQRYLIRISSDYMWHTDLVKMMSFSSDVNVHDIYINVLRGDVDYESMSGSERWVLNQDLHLNAIP